MFVMVACFRASAVCACAKCIGPVCLVAHADGVFFAHALQGSKVQAKAAISSEVGS
jgi:hypothetical protein